MKAIWVNIQIGLAALGGWAGYTLGGFDGFVYALIFFMAADYITGVMRAILGKKLSSNIGFRGIFKKAMIFIMAALGNLIDRELIGSGSVIRTAVIFFYLSNEGISLLENAVYIGLPVPKKLREVLAQLRGKDGE